MEGAVALEGHHRGPPIKKIRREGGGERRGEEERGGYIQFAAHNAHDHCIHQLGYHVQHHPRLKASVAIRTDLRHCLHGEGE